MNSRMVLPLVLTTLFAGPASATIIGTAVDLYGNPVDATNPINFYIPLSENASGVYGVGSAGQSADSCSTAWNATDKCGSGYLGMLLEFEGASAGAHVMTLEFNDLDLAGVNDPYYFFETVAIFALNSTPSFDFVWSALDPLVKYANHTSQTLEIGIDDFGGGNLYFGLLFGSTILNSGTFYNTEETLLASLDAVPVSVPEPATLSLLGAGLLAMGFARRRKNRAA